MSIDGHTAFFGAQGALLIDNSAGPDVVAAAGEAVLSRRPLAVLLAALTARGVDQAPDFACVVHTSEATRLLVRGAFTASALDALGELTSTSGQDVTTWVEQLLPPRTPVELMALSGPSIHAPAPAEHLELAMPADVPTAVPADVSMEVPAEPVPETPPAEDHTMSGWHTSHGLPAAEEQAPAAAADDPFQHMFGHTEYFGAEAAAVRAAEPDFVEAPPVPSSPEAAPLPPMPTLTPPPAPTPAPVASSGLIAGVPFLTRPPAPPPPPAALSPPAQPSDAHTISRAEMLRLAGATPVTAASSPALATGPQLQAVHCPVGHANNPMSETCRTCRAPISDRTIVLVPRPILGKLRFDDGLVHAVHRPVLLGRQPTSDAWTGGEEPQLLPLPDPEQMLSRTHAELRISDWQLQVVDRGSTNGTFVTLPGREPQKLREREPLLLAAGARVSLGGVVSFEFEESGS